MRSARIVALAIGASLLGGSGCADILGIEKRTFVGGASCETTVDCEGNGSFCVAGRCAETPADSDHCEVLEPEEHARVSDYAFSSSSVVLGAMVLEGTSDDGPRVEAMRLGVEEMNRGVGIGQGRQLVMVGCDYGAEGSLEDGLDYLARDLGATVVIGATSSSTTEAAIGHIISREYPTAFVSSFSTSPALSTIADEGLLWRTAPNDEGQAAVLANIIVDDQDVTKLAIIYVSDSYGTGLQQIVNGAVDAGGKDAAPFGYDASDVAESFTTLMTDVGDYGPDGVLVIAVDPANVIGIYQAMVDAGLSVNAHFLADAAKAEPLLDPGLSTEVAAIIDGALGTAPFHSTAQHYETFADNLNGVGVDPNGTSFLAQSYDAAYLAGYGLAYAQSADAPPDGFAVVEGFSRVVDPDAADVVLVGVTDFPGAVTVLTSEDADRRIEIEGTGSPLDFDVTTGDAPGNYEIWRRVAGEFQTCAVCSADAASCDVSGCGP